MEEEKIEEVNIEGPFRGRNKGGLDDSTFKKKVSIKHLEVLKEDFDIIKKYSEEKQIPMTQLLRTWFSQEAEAVRRHNHLNDLYKNAPRVGGTENVEG